MNEQIAAQYRRFAEVEAHGRSSLYEAFALGVAEDAFALEFLAALPAAKRQPNLLLAAVRHVGGTARDWPEFRALLGEHADEVRATMLERRTQTNEPGRCAALLPILARLPQPLALIEAGASAGLCLLPDRYGYDYDGHRLPPPTPDAPVFPCRADRHTPLPTALPRAVWRLGIDLEPVDLADPADAAWLETLVWPEQVDRLHRLRAAIAVARHDRPRVVRADLLTDLPAYARQAPSGATLVVFHSAVLAYVADPEQRTAFGDTVRQLGAVWISNEVPGVLPHIVQQLGRRGPRGAFLLSCDGTPTAWTDPHGGWIEWIAHEERP
ncbi:MAG TPA: DUF2332 domain-containing protein [Acetobacteraceae bacterium]|nr:DUF2332 domain-containing protein [Acetobacteraceae bacterium]